MDDLIRRAQTGDHRAFTSLLEGADERMRRLAYRLLGTEAAMDDALQDAYLKAYRKLHTYDGNSAFATWLYTIVYRTCVDHLRAKKRRKEIGFDAVPEPVAGGADHADRHADAALLDQALRGLPPEQVAAVLLVDGDGLTYEAAATVLGIRSGTVASRLHRAHTALRAVLSPDPTGRRHP